MNYDVILASVGGQGGLSVANVVAGAACIEGLFVKQSELHGMSQRGGAVLSSIRLSDKPVASDIIPSGVASLLLSFEPLECLRYLKFLSPQGTIITATNPLINIPNYPNQDELLSNIKSLKKTQLKNVALIDAVALAKEAGNILTGNIVMVGAASHVLPIKTETLKNSIRNFFSKKGEKIVDMNLRAFELGRNAL